MQSTRVKDREMRPSGSLLLAATFACSIPLGAGHARSDVALNSSDSLSRDAPTVQAMAYLDKLLRERSGGRVRIESLGEGSSSTDTFKVSQVRSGILDMARVNLGVIDSLATPTAVLSLPYLFQSRSQLQSVLDGPIGEELLASLERLNLVGLCFYEVGARSLYGTRPVRSAAEMRGLAVRVPLSTTAAMIVRSLGAIPAPLPDYKVRDALRTRAVDLAVNTLATYVAQRHYAEARFFMATEHSHVPGVLIFSKAVWDGLSREDRNLLRSAARESVAFERERLGAYEAAARRTAEENGAEFVSDLDRASFAKVLRPRWPEILPAADTQGLIRRVLDQTELANAPAK
jgi:TRAP-type C4-dicarboxylate transport system substrate-binding protein